jgi:hypothetical protein
MTKSSKKVAVANVAANVEVDALASYIASLNAQFDARAAYESAKDADTFERTMKHNLNDARKTMTNAHVAQFMLDCNVDASFINRSERCNARYNVKSIDKVNQFARYMLDASQVDVYTQALLTTIIRYTDADLSLSEKVDAVICCSSDNVQKDARKVSLTKQTAKVYSASTVSTQKSSSLNMLQMFNVIHQVRDDAQNVAFVFNKEHKLADKFRAKFA